MSAKFNIAFSTSIYKQGRWRMKGKGRGRKEGGKRERKWGEGS
jgi:hypothetical protein